MKSQVAIALGFVLFASGFKLQAQTTDSISSKNFSISHNFNIGSNFIFGKQFHEYDSLTTPFNINAGYDLQMNFGKHFILQTGLQYTFKPYIFHLKYLNYNSDSTAIVNGSDELNVQYHSIYLRIRPGVKFNVSKRYETSILLNLFYGVNILSNYTHRNLTPQYTYTLFSGGVKQEDFSQYFGGGLHWINLFKIKSNFAIGLDIGYDLYVNYHGLNELFYNSNSFDLETNPHPLMNNQALILNLVFRYK